MQHFDLSDDSESVAREIVNQCLPATDESNPGADYYKNLSTQACRVLLEAMKASGHSLTQQELADHLASYDRMTALLSSLQPGQARDDLRLFMDQFQGLDGENKFRDLLGPISARVSALDAEIKHTIIFARTRTGMSFATDAFNEGFRITDADTASIEALPRVPQSIIDAIVAYGDARADHDTDLGGARLVACIHALRKHVLEAKGEKPFPPPASIS